MVSTGHLGIEKGFPAIFHGLEEIREGGGPGINDIFPGNVNCRSDIVCQMRFFFQDFRAAEKFEIFHAIIQSFLIHPFQPFLFLRCPCGDQGAGFQERQVEALVYLQVFGMPLLNAFPFQGSGRCIKTGMEDCTVALAGAVKDIRRLFNKNR